MSYQLKGDLAAAIDAYEKAKEFSGHLPETVQYLGHAYAVAGRRDEALKQIEELKEQAEQHKIEMNIAVAYIYAGLNDKEQAFSWLERAYERQRRIELQVQLKDWRFDNLRSDPRFSHLARRVGLS